LTPAERAALAVLHRLDPERAHGLSLAALRLRLTPRPGPVTSSRLATTVGGIAMPNPVGLAAGYDKNAEALPALMRAGFGFVEVGAATPRPQAGNPRPRLFRLTEDGAVINRFGFNNDGVEAIAARLAARPAGVPVGLNLGANKDSADRAADYAAVARVAAPVADFLTVNVSSPNTAGLRDLQGTGPLEALLEGVRSASCDTPVWLKIAPDLADAEIAAVAKAAEVSGVSAIVATNTTLARDGVRGPQADEPGGLSGRPLRDRAARVAARVSAETDLPVIGVGGIATVEDAFERIAAGAAAVQLYTALVFGGLSLAHRLPRRLDALLAERGLASVADAVGCDRKART
jgi:dihydroorotate dehydrogenase